MGLFEVLSQKFPFEIIQPFREPVLIIDAKEFKPQWEEQLKAEGCRILSSDYLGRACFFVRKPQEEPKLQGRVDEKQIVECIQQGLNFKQIRDKLGLSHAELMGHLSSLKRKGILDKVGWISTRQRQQKDRQNFAGVGLPSESLTVKELLQASLKLIEEHPRIVKLLLEKASEIL